MNPTPAAAAPSDPTPDADEPTPPARARARTRLLVLSGAIAIWNLPWIGDLAGSGRTGPAGAVALVLGFGLALVALVARTRRDLLCGEAAVSFALAGLVTMLVATSHPWIAGPDRRAVLVPIFGPLALLAALDLVTRARGVSVGAEVSVVRAAAALVAALANFVVLDPVPAGAALLLALLPAAAALPRTARAARRALEGVAFGGAVLLFLAPEIHDAVAPTTRLLTTPTVWAFLHRLSGIGLGVLTGIAIFLPEGDAPDAGPVRAS